ncbi:hypothetical protein [Campylobacter sp.]|uniref:hypothetical protein n=1 Tax=Campylobacter sp. TaxID=205 RepID=UPI00290DBE6F|nr:hypothetical protein [Campylobacter sp.]MDU6827796.1 hypothetical protein [Campylobacter sp.]
MATQIRQGIKAIFIKLEPACGNGAIVSVLKEFGYTNIKFYDITGMMVYAWYVFSKHFNAQPTIHWLDNNDDVLKKGKP